MKTNNLRCLSVSLLMLSCSLVSGQTKKYTIAQIKDTLNKYNDVFKAFDQLGDQGYFIYKIPIEAFRKDSLLKKRSLELLDYKLYEVHRFNIEKLKVLDFYKDSSSQSSGIFYFLEDVKGYSEKQSRKIRDSIVLDKDLKKAYLDSVIAEDLKYFKIFLKEKEKKPPNDDRLYYIDFHSRLMFQEGYDSIRKIYDRYYRKDTLRLNTVTRSLIDMGDPELRAKYDAYFEELYKQNKFTSDDVDALLTLRHSYAFEKLARLLDKNYTVYEYFSSGKFPISINCYINNWQNLIPTLDKEYIRYSDEFYEICKKNKNTGDIKTPENLKKYYWKYVKKMQEQDQPLYDRIKYKRP